MSWQSGCLALLTIIAVVVLCALASCHSSRGRISSPDVSSADARIDAAGAAGGAGQAGLANRNADYPRIDELDRAEGVSLETESGVFTLFVVDKYNHPDRDAATGFDIAWDADAQTLNVSDIGRTANGRTASRRPTDIYFVLYYDNTRLTPTGSEYGTAEPTGERTGILGASTDVLTLAMMNEPGHLEYAIARLNSDMGVRNASFSFPSETQVSASGTGFWSGKLPSRIEGATRVAHSKLTAFSVSFSPSPFLASRSTSTVEERRRNMAPIDFVPQDNVDGSFALNWTERNVGDYDGSGEVGVPDITPIAQNYLKAVDDATTPLERELYEQIDGDGNGEIGIADITPIANNYLNRVEGYDLWRAGEAQPTSMWLPNVENPDLTIAETASAPHPDPSTIPPDRIGLAAQYNYASSGAQPSSVRDADKAPSANESYFYTITPHEDGLDEVPSGIILDTTFGPTYQGSPTYELQLTITADPTKAPGPYMLAVVWDIGERPEVFDGYKADGSDAVIAHTYPGGEQYRPSMTIIAANGFAFAKSLREVDLSQAWHIETVDSAAMVGEYTSIALDSSDRPHISYWGEANDGLKYAYFNGSSWDIETVDSAGFAGYYTSIALDSDNNPHISYWDGSNDDLKYAYYNGSSWDIATVDSAGYVGYDTSIALDSNGRPHISYHDNTNSDLKYAYYNGSSWDIETVDSEGDVGYDTSIAVDSNDHPHISYRDYGNGDLNYAYYNGSSWEIETVDSEDGVGSDTTSIALDSSDRPHISYFDHWNFDLKYAYYNGSSWVVETVDSAGNVGRFTSIALDSNDKPHISYWDGSNYDLKYAWKE